MRDGTGKQRMGASAQRETALAEVGLPLEELVRRGAREIIQRAIEAEVEALLAEFDDVRLLDGRRATTHWMACDSFRQRYDAVEMDPEPIYVKDGKYYSSAGVTAILDLMLTLVEEDFGPEIALRVAQSMVLFLRRPANQSQFSVQLQQSMSANRSIQAVLAYIADRPNEDLSIEALAERANMSTRNFVRVFTREVGHTPGKFVELSRIEAARGQLEQSKLPIGEIAKRCGYKTPDCMRASFDRNLGVAPREYRRRFATFKVAAD